MILKLLSALLIHTLCIDHTLCDCLTELEERFIRITNFVDRKYIVQPYYHTTRVALVRQLLE